MTNWGYREMLGKDVRRVVEIHLAAFGPEYPASFSEQFFNQLGPEYLRLYFAELARSPYSLCLVAAAPPAEGTVDGYAVATLDGKAFYRAFYRRNFVSIALIVLQRMARNPAVRRGVLRKVGSVKRALVALVRRSAPDAPGMTKLSVAYIPFIAVAREARRGRVAEGLLSEIRRTLAERGVVWVEATTNPGNKAAERLFRRAGWSLEDHSDEGGCRFRVGCVGTEPGGGS